jgi:glycosyltransferase involved in cell wall biosynthesis
MTNRVHIKIADRGWILEKCAKEIAERSAGITYGTDPDPSAHAQYYINYSARSRRVSPIEVAFFTHSERDEAARRRYFDTAAEVDHCVCMSAKYANELIEHGIPEEKVTIIAPGVDLDVFQPKVRIGVVGRTYHTGRKGEALVARVMDVPGIEWCFTGSGWPGPSVHVPEGGMPDFYNSLDYVLVPALYEGGPMAVLEGLACGVPIISSDVGWAYEYPHIPFKNGDAESLRRVLIDLVTERQELRASVLGRSWDEWAKEHSQLFERILGEVTAGGMVHQGEHSPPMQVTLITHGSESKSIGGPSVRVPRTAAELAKLGVSASLPKEHEDNFDSSQLAHIFNIWPAESCFSAMDRARAVGKRTVLSPIFLNLANNNFAASTLPRLFSENRSAQSIDVALSEIARELREEPNLPIREPFQGYHERVRTCVESADAVIYLSDYERRCIEYIGAAPRSATLVRNPVDASGFASADPGLFAEHLGIVNYILCVGRIEPRKNQLILAHAARTMGKAVVFIGHTENQAYYDLVREVAGEAGHFIPRIDPADPLLKSAFAGASVFCLPSWAEGAPLAALEAAAAGIPMVLSDRSSEQEYFGDYAEYVNPADVDGLRDALDRAASKRDDTIRRLELQNHMAENYNWQKYAEETAEVYDKVNSTSKPIFTGHAHQNGKIYFDLTTTFHASGNPTGIARVEDRAVRALIGQFGDRVVPIVWNSRTKNYLKISRATALIRTNLTELARMEKSGEAQPLLEGEASCGRIIVVGGSWIRNSEYIAALQALKRETGANLTVLVHDLIQMKLAHFYPEGVGAEFEANARIIVQAADDFLVYSDCTKKDLQEFLIGNGQFFKKISKFRLGDMTDLHPEGVADDCNAKSELQQRFTGKKFAIYVSSIEIRKNHALLINVWRRLIEERGSAAPHLVLVGRSLWRGEETTSALKREARLQQFVHVLDDVDDRDLDWFYRNCCLTLYPSLYEGWGLPVAESLSYGKMCITSNNTATREIAPTLTDLLDPYDFRGWRDRISYYLDNPSALKNAEQKIRNAYKDYPWDESVKEIVSITDNLPTTKSQSAFMFPGQIIEFFAGSRSSGGTAICVGGWGNIERGGRWSLGRVSKLAFRYPAKGDRFYVRLLLHAFTRAPEETRSVRLRINDDAATILHLSAVPTTIDLEVQVRRSEDYECAETVIVFEPAELLSPRAINGSPDERLLGVYLIAGSFGDDLVEMPSPAGPAPGRKSATSMQAGNEHDLHAAKELIELSPRFVGKRPVIRLARFLGLDKIWLRRHARQFRRTYQSLNLIINYLQSQKRGQT